MIFPAVFMSVSRNKPGIPLNALNLSEDFNYNPKLFWINRFRKISLCVKSLFALCFNIALTRKQKQIAFSTVCGAVAWQFPFFKSPTLIHGCIHSESRS